MAKNTDQAFDSIRIVGGLLSSKVLQDARRYLLPGQSEKDYGIESGLNFNDELGRYWRIAKSRWQDYTKQVVREDINSQQLAQEEWLIPLLSRVLDYDAVASQCLSIGEREFPITHVAHINSEGKGTVPLVLCGADHDLDKGDSLFGQEGRNRSPMGLAQEYLNAESTCLWAIVSNGLNLRLLRDNPAMTRPAYIEVDFTRLFEEDNYADFCTLWLLLQTTRLEPQNNKVELCWLEQWREKGQHEGERALDKLRYGVADALRQLGSGFVANKNNAALRKKLSSGELGTDEYFQQVLRLVYRLLFMLTAEDRNVLLLPEEYEGHDYSAARKLYRQGYSISNLRERARFKRHYDHHTDAWKQLLISFQGFAAGQSFLAQPALGGLFADDQCADLNDAELENRYLFSALFNLCYFEHNRTLSRINYRDMDTEEFGSVYESLLELIPQLSTEGQWQFSFIGDAEDENAASGHSRKLTGSYYTPDPLVQELIKSALVPVLEQRLKAKPQNPREAILSITVCDPACGSGHFLLAAARRLAVELARIDAGTDQPTEDHYRHAIRDVVRHCIFGVDLNPMAVELCKTGLWLESIEPGMPLTFLDHHIQNGNSLVGITSVDQLPSSIPDSAFKPNEWDDKKICLQLKKENKSSDGAATYQENLFSGNVGQDLQKVPELGIIGATEDSIDQVEKKKMAWSDYLSSTEFRSVCYLENAYVASFMLDKTPSMRASCITNPVFYGLKLGHRLTIEAEEEVERLVKDFKVFHWHLRFPQIFRSPGDGFDVILGNPPWERIQPEATQYFSARFPEILELKRTERLKIIADLQKTNPNLAEEWSNYRKALLLQTAFIKGGGQIPLSTGKNVNSYSAFAELSIKLLSDEGRLGLVLQSGIVTDDANKDLFTSLMKTKRLQSVFDFENREGIFPSVHRMFRFCLLTAGGRNVIEENPVFLFSAQNISDLQDDRKRLEISNQNLNLLSPNTGLCPAFSSHKDLDLILKIYGRSIPFNFQKSDLADSWLGQVRRLYSTSYDGDLLVTNSQKCDSVEYLQFYEAKCFGVYNHRFSTYSAAKEKYISLDEDSLSKEEIDTKYYVSTDSVESRLLKSNWNRSYMLGYRDITNAKNERCCIASILPICAPTDTIRIVLTFREEPDSVALLMGNLNSLIFDYVAKNILTGTHLSEFIFNQLPVLKYSDYRDSDKSFITSRVLELSYTSASIKPFAEDLGYEGEPFTFSPDRRHKIKCELDAYYAKLYGLSREELRYILDPADVMGDEYPSETFRVLKNREIKELGEYRTQRLVLEAWDRLVIAEQTGQPYQSLVYPPPGCLDGIGSESSFTNESDSQLAALIYACIETSQSLSDEYLRIILGLLDLKEKVEPLLSDDQSVHLPSILKISESTSNATRLIKSMEDNGIRVLRDGNSIIYQVYGDQLPGLKVTSEIRSLARLFLDIASRWKADLDHSSSLNTDLSSRKLS